MKEIFIEAAYLLWTIYYNFVILFIGATKTVGGYPSSEGALPSTQIRKKNNRLAPNATVIFSLNNLWGLTVYR